jgi:hypothetical protein
VLDDVGNDELEDLDELDVDYEWRLLHLGQVIAIILGVHTSAFGARSVVEHAAK